MHNVTYERYVNITNNLENLYIRHWDMNYIKVTMVFIYIVIPIPIFLLIIVIYILYIRRSFKSLYEKIIMVHPQMLKKRLTELKKLSIIFQQLKNISKYENINVDSIIDYIEKDSNKPAEPGTEKKIIQKKSPKKRFGKIKKKKTVEFFSLRTFCFILIGIFFMIIVGLILQRMISYPFYAKLDRMAIFVN